MRMEESSKRGEVFSTDELAAFNKKRLPRVKGASWHPRRLFDDASIHFSEGQDQRPAIADALRMANGG